MGMPHPIEQYRADNGLTQGQLAEQLEVTTPTVSKWESGQRRIAGRLLPTVSERTGIPVQELRPDLFPEGGA